MSPTMFYCNAYKILPSSLEVFVGLNSFVPTTCDSQLRLPSTLTKVVDFDLHSPQHLTLLPSTLTSLSFNNHQTTYSPQNSKLPASLTYLDLVLDGKLEPWQCLKHSCLSHLEHLCLLVSSNNVLASFIPPSITRLRLELYYSYNDPDNPIINDGSDIKSWHHLVNLRHLELVTLVPHKSFFAHIPDTVQLHSLTISPCFTSVSSDLLLNKHFRRVIATCHTLKLDSICGHIGDRHVTGLPLHLQSLTLQTESSEHIVDLTAKGWAELLVKRRLSHLSIGCILQQIHHNHPVIHSDDSV